MKRKPAAFMSYVRFDDEHDNRRLTLFCERLSGEVRVQTGEEFPIFQDRKDIHWGETFEARIKETIYEVTFLIPIITPSFFNSRKCREELEMFLEHEKRLKRNDLILPVYYVDCPLLNDEAKRATDKLAQVIAERQWVDWRELRFEPFTSPRVGKAFEQLAVQIRDALERIGGPKAATKRTTNNKRRVRVRDPALDVESLSESIEATRRPVAKTEPPTWVVDPMYRGDYISITEAIEAADPGDRILVRPGLYQEGLVIDKPLEIVGDGELDEIVIQAKGKNALLFKANMGRVVNLTLRQMGNGNWFCVDIAQGRLELEECDINGQSAVCVNICGGADPRLRHNRIHDSKVAGISVSDNGQGVLEENDIFGNSGGVLIYAGGNPTIRGNRIRDSRTVGVLVYDNGQGTLEDNEIFNNNVEVAINTGGNPRVRHNRIHDGKDSGIYVYDNGQGTLEENEIFGNDTGVAINTGSNPIFRCNHIRDNKRNGVFVYENGQGRLEDNDIFGNAFSGVAIETGGNPTLRRNRINKNNYQGVVVCKGGAGTIEDNDLRDNATGAWKVSGYSESKLKRARNLE